MVKDRNELIQVANDNANQMKTHLRKAVIGFINAQRVKPEELAYVLGITSKDMKTILEGDGNITVDVLSKLLVATDMAVEIKPVSKTPLGGYGREMPRSGGYPGVGGIPVGPGGFPVGPGGVPVGPDGRPLPPPPGFMRRNMRDENGQRGGVEVPMETTQPARDSRGRFVKKAAATRRPATQHSAPVAENPYIGINDAELINIIRQNIWDGEIDVNSATHEQLASFVANKERIMRERSEQKPQQEPRQEPAREERGGSNSVNQFLEMLGNIAREAEHNPQLAETIARFMPQKG